MEFQHPQAAAVVAAVSPWGLLMWCLANFCRRLRSAQPAAHHHSAVCYQQPGDQTGLLVPVVLVVLEPHHQYCAAHLRQVEGQAERLPHRALVVVAAVALRTVLAALVALLIPTQEIPVAAVVSVVLVVLALLGLVNAWAAAADCLLVEPQLSQPLARVAADLLVPGQGRDQPRRAGKVDRAAQQEEGGL